MLDAAAPLRKVSCFLGHSDLKIIVKAYFCEYDSLPTAVVAEELGLNIGLVEALIHCGEIEPTDTSEESKRDRVSRDELARVIEFGLDELLRL